LLDRYLVERRRRLVRAWWGERTLDYAYLEGLTDDERAILQARENEFKRIIGL